MRNLENKELFVILYNYGENRICIILKNIIYIYIFSGIINF